MFRFRCRLPKGEQQLSIESSTPLLAFLQQLQEKVGDSLHHHHHHHDYHHLVILSGFPPKRLQVNYDDANALAKPISCYFKNGDSLIVRVEEPMASTPTPTQTQTPTPTTKQTATKATSIRSSSATETKAGNGASNSSGSSSSSNSSSSSSSSSSGSGGGGGGNGGAGASESSLLHRHIIPDDNSCLFHAIAYCIERSDTNDAALSVRETVATCVLTDDTYKDAAMLEGKTQQQYADFIRKSKSWGGGIELAVLSNFYQIEIVAIDIETLTPFKYGEAHSYSKRIFLVYTGIHYDVLVSLVRAATVTAAAADIRQFDTRDTDTFNKAMNTARQIRMTKGSFTNVAKFTIRCSKCNVGLTGALEAADHAKQTGHTQFQEY